MSIILTPGVLRHPRRRIEADPLARHARHDERDATPVRPTSGRHEPRHLAE
jgi:hypothetical protein